LPYEIHAVTVTSDASLGIAAAVKILQPVPFLDPDFLFQFFNAPEQLAQMT
jgi:hypothetical protein